MMLKALIKPSHQVNRSLKFRSLMAYQHQLFSQGQEPPQQQGQDKSHKKQGKTKPFFKGQQTHQTPKQQQSKEQQKQQPIQKTEAEVQPQVKEQETVIIEDLESLIQYCGLKKKVEIQDIVKKYQGIKEWNQDTIDNFLKDMVIVPRVQAPTEDGVSPSQLKQTQDPQFKDLNPKAYLDFENAKKNIETKLPLKDEKINWKRAPFDQQQARFIQKFLLAQKQQGKPIDPQAMRDMNFNAKKYIEFLGTQEFGNYLNQIFYQKLGLDQNSSFQVFLTELFVNGLDTSVESRVRSLPLEKFVVLILQLENPSFYKNLTEIKTMFIRDLEANYGSQNPNIPLLVENEEFMLTYNLISLAKNHNFFGSMDHFMKEFTRIVLRSFPEEMQKRLETFFNKEVVILLKDQSLVEELVSHTVDPKVQIHHNLLAQPLFQFLPRGLKAQAIDEYKELEIAKEKTQKMRELMEAIAGGAEPELESKIINSSEELMKIIKDIESMKSFRHQEEFTISPIADLERFRKTSFALNQYASQLISERYGFQGIALNNLEDLYDPLKTGLGSMLNTRTHLIHKGMSDQFADTLAKRYINKLELKTQTSRHFENEPTAIICSIVDFFNSKKDSCKALNALHKVNLDRVCLNYQTWREYSQQLAEKEIEGKVKRHQAIFNTPQLSFDTFKIKQSKPQFVGQQVRGFSSQTKMTKDQQREALYDEEFLEKKEEQKKGKFLEFIQDVEKLDQQKQNEDDSKQDYDLSELDISFDKVASSLFKKQQIEEGKETEEAVTVQAVEEIKKPKLSEQEQKIQIERDKLVFEAKKNYNYNFFKNFAFSSSDSLQMSQKALEEFILNTDLQKDIQLVILAMITQAYELNSLIPNIEMVFYRMFCSPITTKEQRKNNDNGNILYGNIFAEKEVSLTYFGYKSLLETLLLFPKKKHFKKVVAHLLQFEDKKNVDPQLISMIIKIGVEQKYPVFLGQTVKYMIENGYNIPMNSFRKFILFIERCKGYEEDAKRFIFLSSETENLEISYETVRPIFLRTLSSKTGNEVLQLFEQFRKNIKLNKSYKHLQPQEKSDILAQKKREFYDGLLKDLIERRAFSLAQIVYSEKMREKFTITIHDQIVGLQIFASQKRLDEFVDLYGKLLGDKDHDVQFNQEICESLSSNLLQFDNEKDKQIRLDMIEKLVRKIRSQQLVFSGKLFDSIVYVYTEAQQWKQIIELLASMNPQNCTPEIKTLNYLKKNLLYCFEPQTRSQLKEQIEKVEQTFFSKSQIGLNKGENSKKEEVLEGDKKWKAIRDFKEEVRGKKKKKDKNEDLQNIPDE